MRLRVLSSMTLAAMLLLTGCSGSGKPDSKDSKTSASTAASAKASESQKAAAAEKISKKPSANVCAGVNAKSVGAVLDVALKQSNTKAGCSFTGNGVDLKIDSAPTKATSLEMLKPMVRKATKGCAAPIAVTAMSGQQGWLVVCKGATPRTEQHLLMGDWVLGTVLARKGAAAARQAHVAQVTDLVVTSLK